MKEFKIGIENWLREDQLFREVIERLKENLIKKGTKEYFITIAWLVPSRTLWNPNETTAKGKGLMTSQESSLVRKKRQFKPILFLLTVFSFLLTGAF